MLPCEKEISHFIEHDTTELLWCSIPDIITPDTWPTNSPDLYPVNVVCVSIWSASTMITSMCCNIVYCMCGAAWSSQWLMDDATDQCMLVFMPEEDIVYGHFPSVGNWTRLSFSIFFLHLSLPPELQITFHYTSKSQTWSQAGLRPGMWQVCDQLETILCQKLVANC